MGLVVMMVISMSWQSLGDHNLSAGCPVDPGHRLFQRDGEAPEISHSKHFKSYWNILNFCVLIWIYIYVYVYIIYICICIYIYLNRVLMHNVATALSVLVASPTHTLHPSSKPCRMLCVGHAERWPQELLGGHSLPRLGSCQGLPRGRSASFTRNRNRKLPSSANLR